MKIVILAAGAGTRLGNDPLPKTLATLANDRSILQLQIEAIQKYASLDQVHIVVGYQKEVIIEHFPQLKFVYNLSYAKENTAKSLYKAIHAFDEDLLWMNADLVFKPTVLEKVINFGKTCLLVNRHPVGEEDVKYRANPSGRILEVSKEVVEGQGEALGINYCSKEDLPLFIENLEKCGEHDYFEKAIEYGIEQGKEVWSVVVGYEDCIEIDFREDLERANGLLAKWESES